MSSRVQLFDAATIDALPWPETDDGRYARDYLLPWLRHGSAHFVANVQTTCFVLVVDETIILPVTLNEQEYTNSYVCSPYAHYVIYAQEELVLLSQTWLKVALALLIRGFGVLCKLSRINRVVHVNNWLLSTNLYPELSGEQIEAVLIFLRQRFPRHAIVFRSLNDANHASLLAHLRRHGCEMVPSRQVYLMRPSDPSSLRAKARWLLKRDLALLERQGYEVVQAPDLGEHDLPRLVELYNALYLEKYSTNNPMFTRAFLHLALSRQTLHLVALRKAQRIDAVLGYFCRNGLMTTPVFGYDTAMTQETGLYRMLSAVLWHIAQEKRLLLHSSSGAARFKRNRGAVPAIEYSAVYARHLPWQRRLCWHILSVLLEKIGVPLIKKYKL